MKISSIKGYDDYGYEVMTFELPTMNEATINLQEFGKAIDSLGINAYEATEAIRRVSELLGRMSCIENEVTAIKDTLNDLEHRCDNQDSTLECRTAALEIHLDDLRSALDAKADKPKQKSDLEIFSQIVPDEDFLIFGDVGWSSDIIELNQTNIFLN